MDDAQIFNKDVDDAVENLASLAKGVRALESAGVPYSTISDKIRPFVEGNRSVLFDAINKYSDLRQESDYYDLIELCNKSRRDLNFFRYR